MSEKLKIKNCKATHGKYNLDNGNVIIQVDVELDTKTITKNIAIKVENIMGAAPKLLKAAERLTTSLIEDTRNTNYSYGLEINMKIGQLEEAIHEAKGELQGLEEGEEECQECHYIHG